MKKYSRRISAPSMSLLFLAAHLSVFQTASAQDFDETDLPTAPATPAAMTIGPDGNVWFIEQDANQIARITPLKTVTEFPVPTAASGLGGITSGPDGNLWFTETATNQIGRITTSGVVTEFPLPTAASFPRIITAGPDGNLWFVERDANKIGRITPAGVVTEFPVPTAAGAPRGIAAGPDGALWFTEVVKNKIGRITTAGTITEFPVPTPASGPSSIVAGTDGNLWFTERDANKIGRITPSGTFREFPIPTASSTPFDITSTPDGIYFVELDGNNLGHVNRDGHSIDEQPLPTAASGPAGITWGPDGTLWITESNTNKVARARLYVVTIPTPSSGPVAATVGPDLNVWIAERDASKIARLDLKGGGLTEFSVPGLQPTGITVGPDFNLWYTHLPTVPGVGRITPSGVITEFPTLHGGLGITAGPDGNLWWAGGSTNVIGHITTGGVPGEFIVSGSPTGIVSGPDGALWFTESTGNAIGRITTAGALTEYPIATPAVQPWAITVGPDGNLWFTESTGTNVGRITPAGVITELPGPSSKAITVGPDGNLWLGTSADVVRFTTAGVATPFFGPGPAGVCEAVIAASGLSPGGFIGFTRSSTNEIAAVLPGKRIPLSLGILADDSGNHVVEPGETFTVSPHWVNWASTIDLTGAASSLSGPGSGTYNLLQGSADYGTAAAVTPVDCSSATGSCYQMSISSPAVRPSQHWDATFVETLSGSERWTWKIHIGGSFADVPSSLGQYRFVETILHNGITGGCGSGNFCPGDPVTRQQIAVFLVLAEHTSAFVPPPCTTPQFGDVPCTSGFSRWINQLVAENVTAGCGNGNYCPTTPVTRSQMSVFLLRALEGSTYNPPACVTPTFSDVPCSNGFAKWIEELVRRGVTAGCGGGQYCPATAVTRGQMAVFLSTTFGLTLYGP
jgi:streptogramin lyase